MRKVKWDSDEPFLIRPVDTSAACNLQVQLDVVVPPGKQLVCMVMEIGSPVVAYLQGQNNAVLIGTGEPYTY